MKTAIIYSSETGFTKKYAFWLQEKLGNDAKVFSLKEAKKVSWNSFDDFEAFVYGGWVCAAQINGAKWFKEKMPSLAASGKKIALWATGGSPMDKSKLSAIANEIRKGALTAVYSAQSGHPGGSLSVTTKLY